MKLFKLLRKSCSGLKKILKNTVDGNKSFFTFHSESYIQFTNQNVGDHKSHSKKIMLI